jgi:hypothetical protein
VLAVLILAYFASLYLAGKAKEREIVNNPQINTNSTKEPVDLLDQDEIDQTGSISTEGSSLKFTSKTDGYLFMFPSKTFTVNPQYPLIKPFGDRTNLKPAIAFDRELTIEHCQLSGKCEPVTQNMSWGAIKLQDSFSTLLSSDIKDQLTSQPFGTNTVYVLEQGVEGEGMFYYFIKTPDNKILMLYRTYINEQVVGNYKNAKGFIPYSQQSQIMSDILKSIKFTK